MNNQGFISNRFYYQNIGLRQTSWHGAEQNELIAMFSFAIRPNAMWPAWPIRVVRVR